MLIGEVQSPEATIVYKGTAIATLYDGKKLTLKCKGMIMADNIAINIEHGEEDNGRQSAHMDG